MQAISGNIGFTGRTQFGVNRTDMFSSQRAVKDIPSELQQDIFTDSMEGFQKKLEDSTAADVTLALSIDTEKTRNGKATKVNVFKIDNEGEPAVPVCSGKFNTIDKSGNVSYDCNSLFVYAADEFFNNLLNKTLKSLKTMEDKEKMFNMDNNAEETFVLYA